MLSEKVDDMRTDVLLGSVNEAKTWSDTRNHKRGLRATFMKIYTSTADSFKMILLQHA